MGHIAGGLKGGMAIGIVLFGVLMGATTGIVGATIITLGLLTLPTLIRRGYDKSEACGVICASGTLGQIIPPSLIMILLSDIMQLSVGTLFAAAVGNWVFRVPLAGMAASRHLPLEWLWSVLVLDHAARMVLLAIAFRRGGWKRRALAHSVCRVCARARWVGCRTSSAQPMPHKSHRLEMK
jgi:hypothetical protein